MEQQVGIFPFERTLQQAILKTMMEDESFFLKCSTYVKAEYFSNKYFSWVFNSIAQYYNKFQSIPSFSVIKNEILKFSPEEQITYLKVFEEIVKAEYKEVEYLYQELTAFTQRAFFINNVKNVAELYNQGARTNAYDKIKTIGQEFNEIDFRKDDVFDFSNILTSLDKWKINPSSYIPLGIRPIDNALWGGLAKGDTCVFLGPTNIGKSLILTNVARNAIENNRSVLFLNLENKENQTVTRMMASLTNIPYIKIRLGDLTDEEKTRILMARDVLQRNLSFKSWYDPNLTINKVFTYCKERFKKKPYDMIVLDYMQMIKGKAEKQYQELEDVMQGLELLARSLDVRLVTACQAKAEGQKKSDKSKGTIEDLLRLTDMGLSFGINRKTDIVVTMTASAKDYKEHIIRFLLDKNRDGEKGVAVECQHNFECSKIFSSDLSCREMNWEKTLNSDEDDDGFDEKFENIVKGGRSGVQ